MTTPSRLVLAILCVLVLGWKLGTLERWQEAFAPGAEIHALLTDSVKSLPRLDSTAASQDSLPLADPFGTRARPSAPAPAATNPRPAHAAVLPGPRPWKLVGLVGTRSAILALRGRTYVVGTGERVDSVRVVSISGTGVTLEDGAGQWTLSTSR